MVLSHKLSKVACDVARHWSAVMNAPLLSYKRRGFSACYHQSRSLALLQIQSEPS